MKLLVFTDKINEVSPEKAVLGGSWHVSRFRFVDDKNVYIEYEDGHIARAFYFRSKRKLALRRITKL